MELRGYTDGLDSTTPITTKKFAVYALLLYFTLRCYLMNYKVYALLVLSITALVFMTGCVGIPGQASDTATASPPGGFTYGGANAGSLQSEAKVASAGSAVPMPIAAPVSADTASQTGSATSVDTKIIKTAFVTLEVKDVPGSAVILKNLVVQHGGYLSSTNVQKGYNGQFSATVVLRVPASEFENTLAGVQAVGTVTSVSTQGDDVTEQYVDLQAQKTSYQNQLAQYNEIMKRALNISDVIEIQAQIDRVQTELDRLEGQLKYLDSRIDLSTITVTLQEPAPVGGTTGYNFITTINNGIDGFLGMVDAIVILLFTLLPLIIIGGAGYAIYRWRKARQPVKAPTELTEKE